MTKKSPTGMYIWKEPLYLHSVGREEQKEKRYCVDCRNEIVYGKSKYCDDCKIYRFTHSSARPQFIKQG